MSTLYVVATPIGNLEDITLRALRIFKEVDFVVAEDTRTSGQLLAHFEIKKPFISFHAQSPESRLKEICDRLVAGESAALVTDAGTPGISDPGTLLVDYVRKNSSDIKVIPVPGPSAIIAALSASGLPSAEFVFLGFLPHKKGRQTLFKEIAASERTIAFYESPHRILKTLESLRGELGPERMVVIGRELTKLFEETPRGTAAELLTYYEAHPDKVRGEFVVLVSGL
jgi:16S rRNA (cytidine1402-2'-O)-methyltransferase